ncbi:MAG: Ig-like domain-containing protein [Candidatus Nanopelagicales bacterium]
MPNHSTPPRIAVATVLVAATLGLSGCTNPFAGEAKPAAQVDTQASSPAVVGDLGETRLTVAADADPRAWPADQPIVVNAITGTLNEVTVTSAGGDETVAGAISDDQRHWRSSGALLPGTKYKVRATMTGSAGTNPVTRTISISTRDSAAQFHALISPRDGATVGVGMPILVTFTAPVEQSHRADVQDTLSVRASEDVKGAWNWVSDTKVQYRTKKYWPARTTVSVTADLAGVRAGEDVWGDQDKQVDFRIGESVVSVVDVTGHQMTVTIDGEVARTIPVTTGKDGFRTRGGTRVISEKLEQIRMDAASTGIRPDDPEYYNLDVRYAMRISNSGEFIHAAPWSVSSQGVANVSHGCVGMSTANAQWLFARSRVGDVVTIVHSKRKLEPGNGLTQWNVSWADWQAGSSS